MKIQVLGSGCPTCKKLYELTKLAAKELNINEEVEYTADVTKIIEMGVTSSPVLAINGKPVMTGSTDKIEVIKDLLRAEPGVNSSGCECKCDDDNCKCDCQ